MRRLSQRRSFRALAIVGITLFVATCAPTFPSGAKIAPEQYVVVAERRT